MYIGIFTMKIILLLALASVGLCNDYGGNQQPPIIHWSGGSGGGGYTSGGRGSSGTVSSSSSGGTGSSSSGGTGSSSSSGGTVSSSSSGGTGSSSSGGTGSSSSSSSSSSGGTVSSSSGGTGSSSSEKLTWSWSSGSDTYQCYPSKNKRPNDPKCLENALQTVPSILEIGESIICRHRNNKENKTDEYYKKLKKATSFFGLCLGCELGQLSGLSGSLGDVGSDLGGTVAETLKALDNLKVALRIAEPIHNVLCTLFGPVLANDWITHLVGKEGSKVTDAAKEIFCPDETELDVRTTIKTLQKADCLKKDVAIPYNMWDNLNGNEKSALHQAVTRLVRGMKGELSDKGFLNKVLCVVGKTVDETLGEVNKILGGGSTTSGGGLLGLGGVSNAGRGLLDLGRLRG